MTETTTAAARMIRWAPVLAAFVTTASMIFAVTTYWQGAREHRQASAIGILQDYLKFSVEHPELASRPADAPIDARYVWFATHTLFTVESLRGYLQQGVMGCDAFDPGFHEFLKSRFPELKCKQT